MLKLLPGVGVALPDGAGVLRFGMTSDEVRALLTAGAKVQWHRQGMALTLAQYRELRHAHDAWLNAILFEPGWNINAIFDGVSLGVGGGGPGATNFLARIDIRADRPTAGPEATPVVWDDIDLFGFPAIEIETVLPGPVAEPGASATGLVVESLGLRFARWESPAEAGWRGVTLLSPGSGRWEQCCEGGLVCVKGGDALVGIMH